MKKVLILGGEGFIGQNIIRKLLADNYMCFSVGTEISAMNNMKRIFVNTNPYQEPIAGTYDIYIHLIDNAVSAEVFCEEELKLLQNIHVKKGAHFIVFSSAAIYADPQSQYAQRKVLFEKVYKKYCEDHAVSLTIFRLFNVYGDYQMPYRKGSLIGNIFCNFLQGKTTIINDKEAKRDFLYASDVAHFVMCAIKNSFFKLTDLGSGTLIPIHELMHIIEKKIVHTELKWENKKLYKEMACPVAENALIDTISLTPLEEGLKHTFNFYKNNLNLILSAYATH